MKYVVTVVELLPTEVDYVVEASDHETAELLAYKDRHAELERRTTDKLADDRVVLTAVRVAPYREPTSLDEQRKAASQHILSFVRKPEYQGKTIEQMAASDRGLLYLDWAVGQKWIKGEDLRCLTLYMSDPLIGSTVKAAIKRKDQ